MEPQSDGVDSWKEMVKNYNEQRHRSIKRDPTDFSKVVTFKEVKAREAEFNPILQRYRENEKVKSKMIFYRIFSFRNLI